MKHWLIEVTKTLGICGGKGIAEKDDKKPKLEVKKDSVVNILENTRIMDTVSELVQYSTDPIYG